MTPEQYIYRLIEISEKKLNILKEILNLTKMQSAIISEESAEKLDRLINLKQQQIDLISELDGSFEVYYARMKSILGVKSIEEISMVQLQGAAELKQVITDISNTTKQIQKLEIDNKNEVQTILDRLASEIRRVKQHKIVNNGYNVASKLEKPSYFFDKKK
ncbi:FlgN protein [Ruminiclostridium sufflavum DSM 19573]|uniref:FlgN protein n=1 Tax=Ruminiclostridium sufflavum DSM 19573 TaxID=1121337 RepID=A0A318Y1A3_9FIRM|nr:flagellar export chaperone FlgN [Ruminiclostridium sufflavum]PYG89129.1 FlgN protein [Ruminiclostridium sufflavum DSM 19573]